MVFTAGVEVGARESASLEQADGNINPTIDIKINIDGLSQERPVLVSLWRPVRLVGGRHTDTQDSSVFYVSLDHIAGQRGHHVGDELSPGQLIAHYRLKTSSSQNGHQWC